MQQSNKSFPLIDSRDFFNKPNIVLLENVLYKLP